MNGDRDRLPDDLVWQDDGHASDVSITALADGQHALLPGACVEHVGGCDACTARLGEAALAALELHEALKGGALAEAGSVALAAPALEPRRELAPRKPVPLWTIAAALAVAAFGALPSLPAVLLRLRALALAAPHALGHAALALATFRAGSSISLATLFASAAVLLSMGVWVSRARPRANELGGAR